MIIESVVGGIKDRWLLQGQPRTLLHINRFGQQQLPGGVLRLLHADDLLLLLLSRDLRDRNDELGTFAPYKWLALRAHVGGWGAGG